jgi:cell division protein ZapA (FtsZ GTPase activity inhibitor)
VDKNQEKLGAVDDAVKDLEHKNGGLEKDLTKGMAAVNKTLEKIYDKVEKIDAAQQEAKTDIKLIQQRLPQKEIP